MKLCGTTVLVMATLLLNSRLQAQPKADVPLERTGEAFVALLEKGEFERATGTFDAAMLKALPAGQLKKTWDGLQVQVGAFTKQAGSRRETVGKYEAVLVTCEFAKATLDARVVFDSDKKVAGLFFAPSKKAKETRRPQPPQRPFPYDEIEVVYENKKAGIKLAGALTTPRTKGTFPAVILITGSGAQDRDETIFGHKPFQVLADDLTRRGIAVLRVDDRGVGGSTGNVSDATLVDFADDVRAGLDFLKGRKEIDAARIGLIGHSEGGIVASLVASETRDVAFIVLLAGPGLRGDEILYLQGAALLKAAGADADALARQKALQEGMFAILRQEKDNAVAETKIRAFLKELPAKFGSDDGKALLDALPLLEGQIRMSLSPWFRHFLDYDPRPTLRKVACPVLAMNGEKDLQVDADANLKAIAAALKEGGNRNVTIRTLPRLNHLFQTCTTGSVAEYGVIEETFAPTALEAIATWILEQTRRRDER